jgi:predicted DNA binding CopG/RHH family protein
MSKPLKPIPEFATEAEERAFWESPKNDSTEYVDWSKAKLVSFPKLRPSTETISLRMPEDLLNTIRTHARKLDVPYQSLIKLWCAEKAAQLTSKPHATHQLTKKTR